MQYRADMSDLTLVKPRKPQVRPALAKAIDQMVRHGLTISQAAENAGMQYESLRVALQKPHVQEHLAGVKRERLGLETLRSWHVVSELRDNSPSDKVRLDAAKTVIAAAGELAPDREPAGSGGMAIQIITHGATVIQASPHGVIEAAPFDPRTLSTPALTQDA